MPEPHPSPTLDSATDIRGRVCVVTGATRGIGLATATELARRGGDVVLVGRDAVRLDVARKQIEQGASQRVSVIQADFASLQTVRRAAAEITERWPAIQLLVNNAGVNSAHRVATADGYEMTFAVNHLAPFLLSLLLVPSLVRGAPARIVNVTSTFAQFGRVDFDDLMPPRTRYNSTRAYNQSKLVNMMFTIELAARLTGTGITVNCVSPGLVATDLLREYASFAATWIRPIWRAVLMTPENAASRVVNVATLGAFANVTGQCFGASNRPIRIPSRAIDAEARRRLWDMSAELTNAPALTSMVRGVR